MLYLRKLDPHVRARVRRGLEELLQHLLRFDIEVRGEEYLGEHLKLRRIRRAVGERTDELRRLADASELEERVRERHALDARQRPGAALRLERVDLREERTQRLHVAAQVRGALVVRVEVVGVVHQLQHGIPAARRQQYFLRIAERRLGRGWIEEARLAVGLRRVCVAALLRV